MNQEQIKAILISNGFTIKEGQTDLKPYVYRAVESVLDEYVKAKVQSDTSLLSNYNGLKEWHKDFLKLLDAYVAEMMASAAMANHFKGKSDSLRYLLLSHVVDLLAHDEEARNNKLRAEITNRSLWNVLKQARQMCQSAAVIGLRNCSTANWEAFNKSITKVLTDQEEFLKRIKSESELEAAPPASEEWRSTSNTAQRLAAEFRGSVARRDYKAWGEEVLPILDKLTFMFCTPDIQPVSEEFTLPPADKFAKEEVSALRQHMRETAIPEVVKTIQERQRSTSELKDIALSNSQPVSGAELPALPHHYAYSHEPERRRLWDEDDMRDYARAALSASGQVSPSETELLSILRQLANDSGLRLLLRSDQLRRIDAALASAPAQQTESERLPGAVELLVRAGHSLEEAKKLIDDTAQQRANDTLRETSKSSIFKDK
jgi:hypothetical protein